MLVFSSLQEILNFTFTIEKPTDGEWGVLQKDGSWSGMVGMLANQEIDLGTFFRYTGLSRSSWTKLNSYFRQKTINGVQKRDLCMFFR